MSTNEATAISHIGEKSGSTATVRGWLYNRRSSGKIQFLIVRDGTGYLQTVVARNAVSPETWEEAERATQECSLSVTGTVREDARAPGGYEMTASAVEIFGPSEGYPITPKEHGVDFLMSQRHLWMRSAQQHAVLRVRSEVSQAIRDFFYEREYVLIDSPILTGSAVEGTSTLFETDYFGDKAYLSQSGQLYLEPAAAAFGKVYCFGPTFRAEKSKTRRHLTEFWMIEPEIAFAGLDEDMDLAEDFLVHIVRTVRERRATELTVLGRDVAALARIDKPFPRITYAEAIKRLRARGFALEWGADLGGDEETALSSEFDRPVMVHRYPAAAKAFYMKADPADPRLALCVDVLAPEGYGEIIGGGQREDDVAVLEAKIAAHGLPRDAFEWYLDLRRYGSAPHAGFGMGIERCVAWLCGLHHVRETIPFPRMLERLRP